MLHVTLHVYSIGHHTQWWKSKYKDTYMRNYDLQVTHVTLTITAAVNISVNNTRKYPIFYENLIAKRDTHFVLFYYQFSEFLYIVRYLVFFEI